MNLPAEKPAVKKKGTSQQVNNNSSTKKILLRAQNPVNVAGYEVEAVKQFTYLGCEIVEGGGSELNINSRTKKAIGAFGMLSPILRNSTMSRRL